MQERILPGLPVYVLGGYFQYEIVFWSGVAALVVALLGWWLGRRLGKYPGRRQVAAEFIVGSFDRLCRDVLGGRRGRRYLPLFGSLFLFVLTCNVIGLLPLPGLSLGFFPEAGLEIGGEPYRDFNGDGAWQPGEPAVRDGKTDWEGPGRRCGFLVPSAQEPTRNMNVPLGLSFTLAIGMYGAVVALKGLRGLAGAFTSPMWFMLPLNLVSAAAQVVSVSFRLFGNIFGGAVITIVAGGLLYNLLLPVGMNLFLGLFVGTIQAFVFTMLWITYHAEVLAEEG
jgi:ATP synthase subunit 6